jgi:hypothetical protein
LNINRGACHFADGIIHGSESLDTSVDYLSVAQDKPVLPFLSSDTPDFLPAYMDFFQNLTAEVEQ